MIAQNKQGQLYICLGDGDIGISSMLMGDKRIKTLCFEQLDRKHPVGEPLDNSEFDPNKVNVFMCFKSNDDILLLIRRLAVFAMSEADKPKPGAKKVKHVAPNGISKEKKTCRKKTNKN